MFHSQIVTGIRASRVLDRLGLALEASLYFLSASGT